jgi:glycosyltransferase involved in cell wall biosynthesis
VLHVCDDLPLPSVHGGRVAIAHEVRAMRATGHDVFVLAFHHGRLTPAQRSMNEELADGFAAVARPPFPRAALRHPLLPYQVSSRVAPADVVARLRSWKPDVAVCHHEWTLPTAAAVRDVPIVLRAHNDELRYYRDLLRSARGVRRAYLLAEYLRIRGYLDAARRYPVARVWLMSGDDATDRWAHVPAEVIPPIMYDRELAPAGAPPGRTLLFLGSLDVPHAVRGIEWFLASVWPSILARVPDATVVVAGRRPRPEVVTLAARTRSAVLVGDPERVDELFAAARVFVNPVFAGSGVNLKLGEPLRRAVPVVTTTVGARGLDRVRAAFDVADAPGDTAAICARLLVDDGAWRQARDRIVALRDAYGAATVGARLNMALLDCPAPLS